jgi:hypothetical protein
MEKTVKMAILYVESVDDESFLNSNMLEKDFMGRDALRIA